MISKLPAFALLGIFASRAGSNGWIQQGRDQARTGAWSQAEASFLSAEASARLLDDRSAILESRLLRVDLRLLAQEIDSAKSIFLPLPHQRVDRADSALWHMADARIQQAQGKPGSEPARTALEKARRGSDKALTSYALLVNSRASLLGGSIPDAEAALEEASRLAGKLRFLRIRIAAARCRLELAKNRPVPALAAAMESQNLAREETDVASIVAILPLRARSEELSGDILLAMETWEALRDLAETTGLRLPFEEAKRERARLARIGSQGSTP